MKKKSSNHKYWKSEGFYMEPFYILNVSSRSTEVVHMEPFHISQVNFQPEPFCFYSLI